MEVEDAKVEDAAEVQDKTAPEVEDELGERQVLPPLHLRQLLPPLEERQLLPLEE